MFFFSLTKNNKSEVFCLVELINEERRNASLKLLIRREGRSD